MANQKLISNEARHAIFVNRYSGGLSRDFIPYLKQLKKELAFILVSANPNPTQKELNEIIKRSKDVQIKIYTKYVKELDKSLNDFAEHEVDFELQSLSSVIKAVQFVKPETSVIHSILRSTPLIFPDASNVILLDAFIKNWANSEIKRVSNIIKTGVITGSSTDEIARLITGKSSVIDKKTLANNRAIVRTAVNHVSSVARHKTMSNNSDFVVGYQWLSVLDYRTSNQCKALDSQIFLDKDTGYKPKAPIHVSCRSTTTPILADEYNVETDEDRRNGISADTTYYEFLKKQSVEFQNETLGYTRAKLFRDGGLNAEQFAKLTVDEKFRPITLEEMRDKNPLAFDRADL